MKRFLIVLISVLIVIAGFIGYKGYIYNKYKTGYNPYMESIDFNNKIQLVRLEKDIEKTYTQYKSIEFLLNEDFEFIEENSNMSEVNGIGYNSYCLNYEELSKYDAQIRIGNNIDVYEGFVNNKYESYGEPNKLKDINIKELFDIYNIKNNRDLYYAVFKESNKNLNILSSKNEIKYTYLLRTLSSMIVTEGNYYFIEGDLDGYIFDLNGRILEVHLYIENEDYIISFWNNKEQYFDLENIKEFLSNVQVN